MPFSLVELQVLSGLAQGKTLASIGQDLVLGQPSISRILHGAEKKAGIQLAQRQGHRLSLTSAGCELAQMAQRVVSRSLTRWTSCWSTCGAPRGGRCG